VSDLVAYLDILGTSDRVRADRFDDIEISDFVNPVCLLAYHLPALRCAAFSDSVVVSAPEAEIGNFLIGLSFLYSQWMSDCVFVRCGIALGEIVWIDMGGRIDSSFKKLNNLAFARVYGKGLLKAQNIEKGSGPGAVSFLAPDIARLVRASTTHPVLQGPVDVLVWASPRINRMIQSLSSSAIAREDESTDAARHMIATLWYYQEMERLGLFTSPDLIPFSREVGDVVD